jgi:hypothetical protein
MNIVIPSYKRSHDLKGKDYFKEAKYCVPESQASEYENAVGSKRLIIIPDDQDGDIIKKRNWILKNIARPLIMIDDDVENIGYFEKRNGTKNGEHRKKILPSELFAIWAKQTFALCEQLNCKMWGVSQNEDNRIYKEFQPFNLGRIILGPFQGHLDHDLFFDPKVGTKDDYDMALQHLHKYKMIFRWNKYHYICSHGDNKGGIVSYRSKDKEIKYCEAIMKKWSKKIIKYNLPPKKITDLLNASSVGKPIAGV